MAQPFQQVYVFEREASLRVRVRRLEAEQPVGTYYLIGDGCSCPGWLNAKTCKHIKMWELNFPGDGVPAQIFCEFAAEVARKFGLMYQTPEPLPEVLNFAIFEVDDLPFDLVYIEQAYGRKQMRIAVKRK